MASLNDILFGGGLAGAFDANKSARQRYGTLGQDAAQRLAAIGRGEVQQGINQNILGSYQNPALDEAIRTSQLAAQRRFAEQVAPGIQQQFAGLGTLGSGRSAVATGIAQRGLEENLSDIESKARLNAYDKAYSAAVNAGANEFQARQSANQYLAGLGSQNIQEDTPSNLAALMGLIGPNNIRNALGGILGGIGGIPGTGNQAGGTGGIGGVIGGIGGAIGKGIGNIVGGPAVPPGFGQGKTGDADRDIGPIVSPPGFGQGKSGDADLDIGPIIGEPPPGFGQGKSGDADLDIGPIIGQPAPVGPELPIYGGKSGDADLDIGPIIGQPAPVGPELPIYGGGSEDYGYYGGTGDFNIPIEPSLPVESLDNFDLFGQENWWNQPTLPTPPDSTEFWPVDSNNNWNFDIDWSLPDFNWDFDGWFDFDFGNWF
jgi:hypothetical protein